MRIQKRQILKIGAIAMGNLPFAIFERNLTSSPGRLIILIVIFETGIRHDHLMCIHDCIFCIHSMLTLILQMTNAAIQIDAPCLNGCIHGCACVYLCIAIVFRLRRIFCAHSCCRSHKYAATRPTAIPS